MPVTEITVIDSQEVERTVATLPALGTAADSASLPVALSTEGKAQLGATNETAYSGSGSKGLNGILKGLYALIAATLNVNVTGFNGREYETVAASQTDQVLGATGASGDDLDAILIVPATTSPGAVSIKDGAGSAITIFTGGSTSVSNLVPFRVDLGLRSVAGAWKVTTGANVSAIGIGNFT